MSKKIFVIAGEASGDLHGSKLIENIRRRAGDAIEIYGVGGDKIRQTGAREFFDLAHFHTTGFTEAIRTLPQYARAKKIILDSIQKIRPDLVVLIDNPGFNLHLAEKIHAMGIPIVYYITPQLWAWAPKRIFKIKRTAKKVLVVFEFEKKIYEEHGIPVSWVGHPLKDLVDTDPEITVGARPATDPGGSRHAVSLLTVSLLPGSRVGEVTTLLGLFLKAAERIAVQLPGISFRIIKSPTLSKEFYERFLRAHASTVRNLSLSLTEQDSYSVMRQSDLAIVCSGTATLECALLGTPMIICNRGSWITYLIAKKLILVPYIGLPNLVLGAKKMPELLQYDATPEKISETALHILKNKPLQESMREDLREVSRKLGEKGANSRAAEEVLRLL